MTRQRDPSGADRELLQALAEAGFDRSSARTLEKWRHEGLLTANKRESLGRHLGSRSTLPAGAKEQAIAVATALHRYRDFDKAAALLSLQGWPIDPERFRTAFLAGLDHLDRLIDQAADGATDIDTIAERVAEGILSERRRTKPERAWQRQLLKDAGDRSTLKRTLASLFRLYIGGASVGGFLAAFAGIGQNFRQLLHEHSGVDDQMFEALNLRLESMLAEQNQAGGARRLLRQAIIDAPPENLAGIATAIRNVNAWLLGLGITFEPPEGFFADLLQAAAAPPPTQRRDTA